MRSYILNTASKLIALFSVFIIIYFVLLDDFLGASIAAIINDSKNLSDNYHPLVFGILPIYIGLVIYGVAVIGFYTRAYILKMLNLLIRSKSDQT